MPAPEFVDRSYNRISTTTAQCPYKEPRAMTSTRSMFTEAIEDHLALKKQNVHLDAAMPLSRFDVGDPLDRYPGAITRTPEVEEEAFAPSEDDVDGGDIVDAQFRAPLEQLNGMTPMLSLVEDLDEDAADVDQTSLMPLEDQVVRFPGGVGLGRDEATEEAPTYGTNALTTEDIDAPAPSPQPVIVIDADEPLAPLGSQPGAGERGQAARTQGRTKRSRLPFRRRKSNDVQGGGWFADGPRDFNWD
jgi:hypothetical protein